MAGHMSFVFAFFVLSALSSVILGTDALYKDIKKLNDKVDEDSDGILSAEEIIAFANTLDLNGNGKLSITEFTTGFKAIFPEESAESAIGNLFSMYQDGGQIDINQLPAKDNALIDRDGDHLLTLEERVDFFKKMQRGPNEAI